MKMATVNSNKSFTRENLAAFCDLFHAIPNTDKTRMGYVSFDVLLNRGIVFIDETGRPLRSVNPTAADVALELFKTSNALWSNSFHKSWNKVATASIEQLVFEQVVHYFSTYGMEFLGLQATPLLPVEKVLTNPDQMPNARAFTVIRIVSEDAAHDFIVDYLKKTVSPHRDKVEGIIGLMRLTDITPDAIKSFELMVARCNQLDIVPTGAQNFLRYMVYTFTSRTTLVKDRATISAIKGSNWNGDRAARMFAKANLSELAAIFHRFKPLFLAFKAHEGCAPYINKIRRLADIYHKPLPDVNVQNVSALMAANRWDDVEAVLARCSGRQLIKLANFASANFGVKGDESFIYNIRNGKVFIKEADAPDSALRARSSQMRALAVLVGNAIGRKFGDTLAGKTYYIPDYVHYAAPVTEKQFIGNIPYGTCVQTPNSDAVTAAIYWKNYKGRTDIDLHMQSVNCAFGWNSGYRSDSRDVLYSGDMTDATNGAVEAFRFEPSTDEKLILTANNFTGMSGVPFDFFMTEKGWEPRERTSWYEEPEAPVDVADAVFAPIPLKFADANAVTIGLFSGRKFYFYGGDLGMSIVPKRELYKEAIDAIARRVSTMLPLSVILSAAGATLVTEADMAEMDAEDRAKVIDLSPSALTARSLLDIVDAAE